MTAGAPESRQPHAGDTEARREGVDEVVREAEQPADRPVPQQTAAMAAADETDHELDVMHPVFDYGDQGDPADGPTDQTGASGDAGAGERRQP